MFEIPHVGMLLMLTLAASHAPSHMYTHYTHVLTYTHAHHLVSSQWTYSTQYTVWNARRATFHLDIKLLNRYCVFLCGVSEVLCYNVVFVTTSYFFLRYILIVFHCYFYTMAFSTFVRC